MDLSLLAMDPYLPNPMYNVQWNPVPLGVIDLYAGFYDMKKYEAKQFVCTYLVPNFINLLSLSPELEPAVTHIMKTPMPIRGYLCYLLMKAKIGERKQLEWKNLLRDRMIQRLVDKTRGLELDLANMNMSDGAQKRDGTRQ